MNLKYKKVKQESYESGYEAGRALTRVKEQALKELGFNEGLDSAIQVIDKELKKYEVMDNLKEMRKRHLYEGLQPLTEYVFNQDIGARAVLKKLKANLLKLKK